MMEYCTNATLDPCREEAREQTIKMNIQETFKILCETNATLMDFAQIVNGKTHDENVHKDANSLWEESRLMVAQAYENLQRLNEIKRSII